MLIGGVIFCKTVDHNRQSQSLLSKKKLLSQPRMQLKMRWGQFLDSTSLLRWPGTDSINLIIFQPRNCVLVKLMEAIQFGYLTIVLFSILVCRIEECDGFWNLFTSVSNCIEFVLWLKFCNFLTHSRANKKRWNGNRLFWEMK